MGSHTITRPANGVILEFLYPVGQRTGRDGVSLFWLAPDGTEVKYATFAAGASGQVVHTQATFEGDTWLVRDGDGPVGDVLLVHVATGAHTQRVLVRDGLARAADSSGGSGSLGKRPVLNGGDGAAGSGSSSAHAGAAAADDDEHDEELQRALALSLADRSATADDREAPPAVATKSERAPPREHALSLSDARALSVQLAAQAAVAAHALAAQPTAASPQAEARLQCRFPDLDAAALTVRLPASAALQPLLDAILAHVEAAEAEVGAAWSELRVACRAPPLVLTLARSGLVRHAEPEGAQLDGTIASLGLLPSAVLHVTRTDAAA
jgi:hypothetical protein